MTSTVIHCQHRPQVAACKGHPWLTAPPRFHRPPTTQPPRACAFSAASSSSRASLIRWNAVSTASRNRWGCICRCQAGRGAGHWMSFRMGARRPFPDGGALHHAQAQAVQPALACATLAPAGSRPPSRRWATWAWRVPAARSAAALVRAGGRFRHSASACTAEHGTAAMPLSRGCCLAAIAPSSWWPGAQTRRAAGWQAAPRASAAAAARRHQPAALKPCRAPLPVPWAPHQCKGGLLVGRLWRIVPRLRPGWAGAPGGQCGPPARCLTHAGGRPAWQPGAREAQGALHRVGASGGAVGGQRGCDADLDVRKVALMVLTSAQDAWCRCSPCRRSAAADAARPILEARNLQLPTASLSAAFHSFSAR